MAHPNRPSWGLATVSGINRPSWGLATISDLVEAFLMRKSVMLEDLPILIGLFGVWQLVQAYSGQWGPDNCFRQDSLCSLRCRSLKKIHSGLVASLDNCCLPICKRNLVVLHPQSEKVGTISVS